MNNQDGTAQLSHSARLLQIIDTFGLNTNDMNHLYILDVMQDIYYLFQNRDQIMNPGGVDIGLTLLENNLGMAFDEHGDITDIDAYNEITDILYVIKVVIDHDLSQFQISILLAMNNEDESEDDIDGPNMVSDDEDEMSVNYLTKIIENNTYIKDMYKYPYDFSPVVNLEIKTLIDTILGDLKTAADIHF